MTRKTAREIAVMLAFWLTRDAGDPEKSVEDFFDMEYFESLGGEDELFNQYPNEKQLGYIKNVVTGVLDKIEELDSYIEAYSKGWKINRISRTAVVVMRVAIYEILYVEDVPESAAINEAVEIAKGYDEPDTVAFVNGILGAFSRARATQSQPEPEEEAE